jgi:hypothetical protein
MKLKAGGWTKIQVGEGPSALPGEGRKIMATVSKRTFIYEPVLLDLTSPKADVERGDRVRLAKLHGAPPPGTMGQYHVARPGDGKLLGMVCAGSLTTDEGRNE